MGRLAEAFRAELVKAGYDLLSKEATNQLDLATTEGLPGSVRTEVLDLHRALGGTPGYLDFTSGKWDFATADGLFIEFDEQLHFNRYRKLTDQLSWAKSIPWSTDYLHYCSLHEDQCLKAGGYGGRWTSPSTEKMFGVADPPRVFDQNGSPRWKQRALYDAVKDAYAIHGQQITMARVSIHDEIGGRGVLKALGRSSNGLDTAALREFLTARTTL